MQIVNIKQNPVQKSTKLLTDNQEMTDPKLVADTFTLIPVGIWLKLP